MGEYDQLARAAEGAGNEVFWQGAAASAQIKRLESMLGVVLPSSFKRFLVEYGGGGIVSAEISGIENNDAANDSGGTLIGDTRVCRARYGLPAHLVVIYFHDDEVCWCLDTSNVVDDECPVVSYSVFLRKVDRHIAEGFTFFMRQHLAFYAAG